MCGFRFERPDVGDHRSKRPVIPHPPITQLEIIAVHSPALKLHLQSPTRERICGFRVRGPRR